MPTEDQNKDTPTPIGRTWEHSFDEAAKGLASGMVSRRGALKLVGGALLGGLLASIPGVALAQGRPPTAGPGAARRGGCPSGTTFCNGSCVTTSCQNSGDI